MKIEIHVYNHSPAEDLIVEIAAGMAKALQELATLIKGQETAMTTAKEEAAKVAASEAQLGAQLQLLVTATQGIPAVVAKAVADALANAGVDDAATESVLESVDASIQQHIADVGAALANVGPPAGGNSTGGGNTTGGGASDLALTTTALTAGVVGQAYADALAITGGTPPYAVASTPDSQNGILVGADGRLSGTPKNTETDTFEVTVTDSAGAQVIGNVTIDVAAGAVSG